MRLKSKWGGVFLNKNILSRTKQGLVIGILLCSEIGNVGAITTNDVTYNNNGIEENLTETLDTLYTELKGYKTGGNVTPSEMLEGSSGYSKGILIEGSIKKKEATTYTPGVNNITISKGQYLNGDQIVLGDTNLKSENIKSGVSLFGIHGTYTSDANAFSGAILSGHSAYVNGSKIDGTMANNFTNTGITLTTADTRPVNVVRRESGDSRIWYLHNSDGVQRLNIGVPNNGYYDTRNTLAIENADIASELGISGDKIVKGNTIAGVSGTAPKVTTFYTEYNAGSYNFGFDNHKSAFSFRVSIRDQYPNYRNITRENIFIDIASLPVIVYGNRALNYLGGNNLMIGYNNTTGEIVLTGSYNKGDDGVEYGISLSPNAVVGIRVAIIE